MPPPVTPLRSAIDAIVARLETIPDIGHVYPFPRWSASWADVFARYLWTDGDGTKKYRAWTIQRIAPVEYVGISDSPAAVQYLDHSIVIRGYRSQSDQHESERAFQDTVNEVLALMLPDDGDDYLYLTNAFRIENTPQAFELDTRMFGDNILSHYCGIRFDIRQDLRACG